MRQHLYVLLLQINLLLLFSDVCQPLLETFPHDVTLAPIEAVLC